MNDTEILEQQREHNEAQSLRIMAKQLSYVFNSDDVSDDAKNVIEDVLINVCNEIGLGITSPELIEMAFPLIIKSLNFNYGLGIYDALRALLESPLIEGEVRTAVREIGRQRVHFDRPTASGKTDILESEVLQ